MQLGRWQPTNSWTKLLHSDDTRTGSERRDATLDVLLDLDGQKLVVDPQGGYWVRFGVTRVVVSSEKPHGLDYTLTPHGPDGERLVGFDNAYPVRRQQRGEQQDHRRRLRSVAASVVASRRR